MIDLSKQYQTQLFEPVRGLFEHEGRLYGHYQYKNGHWVSDIWHAKNGRNQYPDTGRDLMAIEPDNGQYHATMYDCITNRIIDLDKMLYLLDIPVPCCDKIMIDGVIFDPWDTERPCWEWLDLDKKSKILIETEKNKYLIKIEHTQ